MEPACSFGYPGLLVTTCGTVRTGGVSLHLLRRSPLQTNALDTGPLFVLRKRVWGVLSMSDFSQLVEDTFDTRFVK